jgi:hypothetical protein
MSILNDYKHSVTAGAIGAIVAPSMKVQPLAGAAIGVGAAYLADLGNVKNELSEFLGDDDAVVDDGINDDGSIDSGDDGVELITPEMVTSLSTAVQYYSQNGESVSGGYSALGKLRMRLDTELSSTNAIVHLELLHPTVTDQKFPCSARAFGVLATKYGVDYYVKDVTGNILEASVNTQFAQNSLPTIAQMVAGWGTSAENDSRTSFKINETDGGSGSVDPTNAAESLIAYERLGRVGYRNSNGYSSTGAIRLVIEAKEGSTNGFFEIKNPNITQWYRTDVGTIRKMLSLNHSGFVLTQTGIITYGAAADILSAAGLKPWPLSFIEPTWDDIMSVVPMSVAYDVGAVTSGTLPKVRLVDNNQTVTLGQGGEAYFYHSGTQTVGRSGREECTWWREMIWSGDARCVGGGSNSDPDTLPVLTWGALIQLLFNGAEVNLGCLKKSATGYNSMPVITKAELGAKMIEYATSDTKRNEYDAKPIEYAKSASVMYRGQYDNCIPQWVEDPIDSVSDEDLALGESFVDPVATS